MNSKLTRWCDGFLEAGWLFALIATPLFFNIHSDRVFEPDKITLLRSLALMMVLIWIVKFVDQQGWRDRSWLKWNSANSVWRMPLVLPMMLIVVSYLVSTLFSVAPRTSLLGSYQRLQGTYTTFAYIAIFAVVLGNLRTQKQVQRLITTVIVVSIPVSIYGMLQRYKLDPLPWGGNTSTRIAGHMGNAIFVAAYLIMATPLTIARIIDSFKNILTDAVLDYADVIRSSIYILALAVQLIAIYWTQSRGPLLGIGIGMFAFILILLVTLRNVAQQEDSSARTNFLWPLVFVVLGIASLFVADMVSPSSGSASFFLWLGVTGALLVAIFVLAAARRGWAWLWLAWIGMVGLTGLVLVVYNVSTALGDRADTTPVIGTLNDTFDEWRGLPTIGRFGTMLDTEEGTSTVRLLIWTGVIDLVSPHDPIESPVSGSDKWNVLRPLIGYGPEAMYVAYNSFYPPELAIVEARNASPDRAHNETFDAVVITGILGYLAWQILYVATFYYGLKQLGVVNGKRERNLLVGLWFAGAIAASIVAMAVGGAVYLGVAAPFGSIIGLVIYLIYYALFGRAEAHTQVYNINTLVMVSLIAAMIAYYVEIHFGIAIVSTRTHAFVYTALIVVLAGMMNTSAESEKLDEVIEASTVAAAPVRRSRKARSAPRSSRSGAGGSWLGPVLAAAGLMTAIMVIFGFGFTNYTVQSGEQISTLADVPSSADIFRRAFFVNPRQGFIDSPYLFGVVILSWLLGSLLFTCEMVKDGTLRIKGTGAFNQSYARIAAGVLLALFLVSLTTFLGDITPETQHMARVGRVSGTFFGLLSLASAVFLFLSPDNSAARTFAGVIGTIAALFAIPLLVAGASVEGILLGIGGVALLFLLWNDGWRNFSVPLLIIGFVSLLGGLMYALIHAGLMREVLFLAPDQTQIDAVGATLQTAVANGELFVLEGQIPMIARRLIEASRIDQYLTTFYLVGFVCLLFTGAAIAWRSMSAEKKTGSVPGLIALVVALVLGFFLTDITNLNIIQADMIYKRGKPFDQQASRLLNEGIRAEETEQQQQAFQGAVQNWQIASTIYEDVVDLTPNEDFYFLWLGRSYLEQSRLNSAQQAILLDQAKIRLENAQQINPLNTDHTANLARLNTRWADIRRDDPEQRAENIDISKGYYEDALALSPQNSLIRNEYANLFFQLSNDCENALRVYEESAAIDKFYDRTYISTADVYIRCASREGEPRADHLQSALDTVDAAIAGVPARLQRAAFNNSMANIHLRVAREFVNDGDTAQARTIVQEAIDAGLPTEATLDTLTQFIEGLDVGSDG